jgi:hypothetical protein
VYGIPFVNPDTTSGLLDPEAVTPPGLEVTVYPVIAEPPMLLGAVKLTDAVLVELVALPTAETAVGGCGLPSSVTLFEADDAAPVPTELLAFTVKV